MLTACPNLRRFPLSTMPSKKLETSTSPWSNLCVDISCSLLDRLSIYDQLRFRDVCKSWRFFANTHIMWLFTHQPPLLMFRSCLYNLEDNGLSRFKSYQIELMPGPCLGSSRGWLVSFDENKKSYYLFNPIIDARISLGSLPKLACTSKIVLWSDPILSGSKYAVVAIYRLAKNGCQWKIAYAICGDNSWSFLDSEFYPYCDIICDNKCVYALSESGFVEAWEFRNCMPIKTIRVPPRFPPRSGNEYSGKGLHTSCRCYLVKSQDNLLMVERNVQVLGSIYGNKIKSGRRLLSWQCKTLSFRVYRLTINGKNWVKTDSLGDRIIVLGANQSILLSSNDFDGYQKNSIYFSDDYWGLNFRDYHDDGCDTGVFSLGDGSIKFILKSFSMDSHPPPIWVVSHL